MRSEEQGQEQEQDREASQTHKQALTMACRSCEKLQTAANRHKPLHTADAVSYTHLRAHETSAHL
eukprot:70583-Alexandrium_andersonii.AAC.1